MARAIIDLARYALREAYAVQASDTAARAHAHRVLVAQGHDEPAAAKAVDAAFARWFDVTEPC